MAKALVADFSQLATSVSVNGPLEITFVLTPTVVVKTSVFGTDRNMVTVSIINGSITVWSASMTQAAPTATLDYDLILGTFNIKKGATFRLTIPTTVQPGNVFMQAEVQTPPNPWQPFSAIVASWTLT